MLGPLWMAVGAALAAEAPDTSFLVGGYGSLGLAAELEQPAVGFDPLVYSPILMWRHGERFLIESEVSLAMGEEGFETALEYLSVDMDVGGPVVIAGLFLTPVGQFISRLHPAWIDRFPDFPLPYRVGRLPMSQLGVALQQVVRLGNGGRVAATLFVDNGPGGEPTAPEVAMPVAGTAWGRGGGGGRLAVFPVPSLEIGFSGYAGMFDFLEETPYLLGVADAAWQHPVGIDLRGEFIRATWEGDGMTAAWAWLAWRLRPFPRLDRLEPAVRLGWAVGDAPAAVDTGGLRHGGVDSGYVLTDEPIWEFCYGLNYYLRPELVLKATYVHRVETWSPSVRVSLGFGF